MKRKLFALLIALLLVCPFVAKAEENTLPEIESIAFTESTIVIEGRKIFELEYTTVPENASRKGVEISIEDYKVVSQDFDVDNEDSDSIVLMTWNPGTTKITLTAPNGATATATVVVNDVDVEGVSFEETEYTFGVNNRLVIGYHVSPENAFEKSVTFESSDESVVNAEYAGTFDALFNTVGEGDATLNLTVDGFTAETTIHSVFKPVEGITITSEPIVAGMGVATIQFNLEPWDASEHKVIATSDHPDIAMVSEVESSYNGGMSVNLMLLKQGEATITLVAENGSSASLPVTVTNAQLESIMFALPVMNIPSDCQFPNALVTTPFRADVGNLTFTSTDESVAKVSSSVPPVIMIETGKEGTAIITCTTENGLSCSTTVISEYVEAEDIFFIENEVTLEGKGKTKEIEFSQVPALSSSTGIVATSDNPEVATADFSHFKFTVTSGKPGTANVTVTLPNGKSSTCKVTVTEVSATNVSFVEEGPITLVEGNSGSVEYTYDPAEANGKITATVDDPTILSITPSQSCNIFISKSKRGFFSRVSGLIEE